MMKPSSVLYVTDSRHGHGGWHDPSARHRCYHFADALVADSWAAAVVHVERLTEQLIEQFQHVIFHRPKFTKRFAAALELCRHCDVYLHADYDDLIFNPALASCSPLYINGNRPLHKVEAYFRDNLQAMQNFDSVLVSTRALATHVLSFQPGANVTVVPNSLPRLFQTPRTRVENSSVFTIGYFPGSNSHSHDMELLSSALTGLFESEPACKLIVMGRMDPANLALNHRHVEFKSFVDYNRYLVQLAQVDLSIAPLQRNVFNDSKSAVKLIESVAVGTPILASWNPDMEDHQNPMSALVKDDAGWLSMLLKCVRQNSGFDCSVREGLMKNYSVATRLPVLQHHLSRAA